jgi:hypothetical protein
LPVTFRDANNYRTERLIFEVVDFSRPYHVIMGWPCYVKFMAITSYAYLKHKISGPTGIITMEAKAQRALDCEQDNIELAAVAVAAAELKELCLSGNPLRPTRPSPQCLTPSRLVTPYVTTSLIIFIRVLIMHQIQWSIKF